MLLRLGRVFVALFWAAFILLVVGAGIAVEHFPRLLPWAKDYSFPEVRIDATVDQDGSLSVVERRTFDFRGSFSFAFFTVEHRQPGDVTDFSIRDGATVYRDTSRPGAIPLTQEPLAVEDTPQQYKATWYFTAQDERRTFEIRYTVRCAVDVLRDTAYLNWQFIGTGWEKPTEHALITVRVPGHGRGPRPGGTCAPDREPAAGRRSQTRPLAAGEVRAFGHGPLQGEVRLPGPQRVVLEIRDLAPFTFVEGSILFPQDAVPFVAAAPGPVVGPDPPGTVASRGDVLAAERRLADEANSVRRKLDLIDAGWKVIAVLLPLALVYFVWLSFRRDRVPGVPGLLQEPPEDVHPVELALLWAGYTGRFAPKHAYRAQLLSLAEQGVIEVTGDGQVSDPRDLQVRMRKPPGEDLDVRFTSFLFDGVDVPISLGRLKARGSRRERLKGWWKVALKRVKQPVERIREGQTRLESVLSFLSALGAAAFGWWAWQQLDRPAPLLLIPGGLIGWAVATRIIPPRLSPHLRGRLARWKAFRRFLTRFSTLQDAPALAVVIWERYLVYATALGVARRVTKQVRAVVPEEDLPPPWPGAPRGSAGFAYGRGVSLDSPARAAVGTSSDVASSITWSGSWGSGSSSSGGGGGFSGGGGGGGGGTGGGAG